MMISPSRSSTMNTVAELTSTELPTFTKEECQRIALVIQKDIDLRNQERRRLKKCEEQVLLKERQIAALAGSNFNEYFCIICFSRFFFIFNSKRQCHICLRYFCRSCGGLCPKYDVLICKTCQEQTDLLAKNCVWFYRTVQQRHHEDGTTLVAKQLLYSGQGEGSTLSTSIQSLRGSRDELIKQIRQVHSPKLRNEINNICNDFRQQLRKMPLYQLEQLDLELADDFIVKQFQQKLEEILKNFSQMLFVTLGGQLSTSRAILLTMEADVIDITKEEVETIVGYRIKLPCHSAIGSSVVLDKVSENEDESPLLLERELAAAILQKTYEDLLNYQLDKQAHKDIDWTRSMQNGLSDLELLTMENNYHRRASTISSIGSWNQEKRLGQNSQFEARLNNDPDLISLSGVSDHHDGPMVSYERSPSLTRLLGSRASYSSISGSNTPVASPRSSLNQHEFDRMAADNLSLMSNKPPADISLNEIFNDNCSFDAEAKQLHFLKRIKDQECCEGEKITIKAQIVGVPPMNIRWLDSTDRDLRTDSRVTVETAHSPVSIQQILTLWECERKDSGIYRCIVSDALETIQMEFRCTVNSNLCAFSSPRFEEELRNATVAEGRNARFRIRTSGYPEPRVMFSSRGQTIFPESGKYEIKHLADDTYSLTIYDVRSRDTGWISCTASNPAGTATCQASLRIMVQSTSNFSLCSSSSSSSSNSSASSDSPRIHFPAAPSEDRLSSQLEVISKGLDRLFDDLTEEEQHCNAFMSCPMASPHLNNTVYGLQKSSDEAIFTFMNFQNTLNSNSSDTPDKENKACCSLQRNRIEAIECQILKAAINSSFMQGKIESLIEKLEESPTLAPNDLDNIEKEVHRLFQTIELNGNIIENMNPENSIDADQSALSEDKQGIDSEDKKSLEEEEKEAVNVKHLAEVFENSKSATEEKHLTRGGSITLRNPVKGLDSPLMNSKSKLSTLPSTSSNPFKFRSRHKSASSTISKSSSLIPEFLRLKLRRTGKNLSQEEN